MNDFDEVKAGVPVPLWWRDRGFEEKRGFGLCLYHSEKTPSMRLYDRSFFCFGCGAHGSVIDLECKLFNVEPLEAVKRLNDLRSQKYQKI